MANEPKVTPELDRHLRQWVSEIRRDADVGVEEAEGPLAPTRGLGGLREMEPAQPRCPGCGQYIGAPAHTHPAKE